MLLFFDVLSALAVFNTPLTASDSKMLSSALPTEDWVGFAFRLGSSAIFVVV